MFSRKRKNGDETMMNEDTTTMFQDSKFPMGRIVITANALKELPPPEVEQALVRHSHGYWGALNHEEHVENAIALEKCLRLASLYHTANDTRFWVVTEADRSHTTILLPGDY